MRNKHNKYIINKKIFMLIILILLFPIIVINSACVLDIPYYETATYKDLSGYNKLIKITENEGREASSKHYTYTLNQSPLTMILYTPEDLKISSISTVSTLTVQIIFIITKTNVHKLQVIARDNKYKTIGTGETNIDAQSFTTNTQITLSDYTGNYSYKMSVEAISSSSFKTLLKTMDKNLGTFNFSIKDLYFTQFNE